MSDDTINDNYQRVTEPFKRDKLQSRTFARPFVPSWQDIDEVAREAALVAWRNFGEKLIELYADEGSDTPAGVVDG